MNIILVTRFYPPDTGGGGIAAYARYAAMGLLKKGHEVRIISCLAPGSKPFEFVDGITVYRIRPALVSYRWSCLPIAGRHIRFVRDILYAWRIRRTLISLSRNWVPHVVEYADIDAEGLFHPSSCPYVVKLHTPHEVLRSYYTQKEADYAWGGIEYLEARAIQQAAGVSAPSYWLAREVALLKGIRRNDFVWVPNPIDTDFFSPNESSLPSARQLSVLYVGRLEPRKGALVFAKAIPVVARAVPNVRFIYVGMDRTASTGGSQKAELEAYFRGEAVRGRVEFHGHSSLEVFRDFYRRSSIFVMPSLLENCPYTLLEAMSCGKAVIASNTGGISEIIEDGKTGLLFEAGDAGGLAESMIKLLQCSDLRARLGRAAREKIFCDFSLDEATEVTERFYRSVISRYSAIEVK